MSVWCFLGSLGEGNDDYELLATVPLVEGVIGTAPSCAIRLGDPLLSKEHARVTTRDGAWYVRGLDVTAQTQVRGIASPPAKELELAHGDLIELGSTRLRYGGEPPARHGVDANDRSAVLVYADQLASRGAPLGTRILEGAPPQLPGQHFEDGLVVAEWKNGLVTSLAMRELHPSHLRTLLADDAMVGLEQLSFSVGAPGGSETDGVRMVLHVLAETKPPRLRKLDLGWVHQDISIDRAGRDWRAVAQRLPLEGTLRQAFRRAGLPRLTMLRTTSGWPPLGTVPLGVGMSFGAPEPSESVNRMSLSSERRHAVVFGVHPSGADFLRVNGLPSAAHRRLIHGDLVELKDVTFRFEEDPR